MSSKRTKLKRFLAMTLAAAMVLQQTGLPSIAEELPTAATEAVVVEMPETAALETAAPETQAPETQAPETVAAVPETQAPETAAPETAAPETQAPETAAAVPETQAPETAAPETAAPETQAPETEAPSTETQATEPTKPEEIEEVTTEAVETPETEIGTESETEVKPIINVSPIALSMQESNYELQINVTTALEGKTLEAGDFTVSVKQDWTGNYYEEKANNAAGKVIFGPISLRDCSLNYGHTHTYTIKEVDGQIPGMSYDDTEYRVTISVDVPWDDHSNRQITEVKYLKVQNGQEVPVEEIVFNNSYEQVEVEDDFDFDIHARIEQSGGSLKANNFTVSVKDQSGNYYEEKKNNADGEILFEAVSLKECNRTDEHYHEFIIEQENGVLAGVTYDNATYNLKIHVLATGEIKTVTYTKDGQEVSEDNIVFKNAYKKVSFGNEASYTLDTFLKNGYNIISFGDAEIHQHTVGGMLVGGNLSGAGVDGASDLPSFVKGKITTSFSYASGNNTGRVPILYVGSSNTVTSDAQGNRTLNGISQSTQAKNKIFISDDYFNFAKAESVVINASSVLEEQCDIAKLKPVSGVVTVPAGSYVTIESLVGVNQIDIVNSNNVNAGVGTLANTVITIKGDAVEIPLVTINGSQISSSDNHDGALGGTSIVWNCPDATSVGFSGKPHAYAFAGHVIAPNATITSEASNYAGTLIGRKVIVYGEGHRYPYYGGGLVPTDVAFFVRKTLEGRKLVANEFTFTLKPDPSNPNSDPVTGILTGTNSANGRVVWGTENGAIELVYTELGTYIYTVEEIKPASGEDDQITYDSRIYTVTVTITDNNGDGKLESSVKITNDQDDKVDTSSTVRFVNKYNKKKEVDVSGTKTWNVPEGTELPESITVILKRDGLEIDRKTVKASDGWKYEWKDLPQHSEDGKTEYTYTIDEEEVSGYYKDVNGYDLKNTYKGTTEVEGKKTWVDGGKQHDNASEITLKLTRKSAKPGSREEAYTGFEVTWEGNSYSIKDLPKYDAEGYEYTYSVEEVKVPGYDTEQDGNDFTNTYEAKGSVEFGGEKKVAGTDSTNRQFTFDLFETDENFGTAGLTPIDNQTVTGADSYEFGAIEYVKNADKNEEGTHYYVVKERIPAVKGGFTYDETEYEITVVVKDNGFGTLTTAITVAGRNGATKDTLDFTNTYATKGEIVLGASKTYDKALTGNEFSFLLVEVDENGEPVANGTNLTAWNDADGNVVFDKIEYTKAEEGAHYYQISEVFGGQTIAGTAYDGTIYTVIVTVVDNGDGTLTATADTMPAQVVFENEYNAEGKLSLNAEKAMKDPDTELATFRFVVEDADSNVIATSTNDADGKIDFTDIVTYDYDDAGKEFVYTVKESAWDVRGIYLYDTTVYTVTVNVTDNSDGTLNVAVTSVTTGGSEYTGTMKFENDITNIRLDKVDKDGNRVTGVVLQVVAADDTEGDVIDKWTTNGTIHDLTGKLEVGRTYILEEVMAPTGYAKAEPIKFTVNEAGQAIVNGEIVETVVMTDENLHFNVNKVELGNDNEVDGAELVVFEKQEDGTLKEVDRWTSKKGERHDFGGKLKAGKEYVLREEVAPDGYVVVTDIEFTVENDGSITVGLKTTTDADGNTVYLVEDDTTKVDVSKKDATTDALLAGAELRIVDAAGNVVEQWTSENEIHHIAAKLVAGQTYTLVEISAPANYEVAEPVTFTVSTDGSVDEVIMKDARIVAENASLAVTKSLANDGMPLMATDQTFYVALYADEELTNRISDVKELVYQNAVSSTVVFDNLELGRTYYVGECTEDGVAFVSSMVADGTVFAAIFNDGNSATVENADDSLTVYFENQFAKLPSGFYRGAELTITKKLLGMDGAAKNSDDVFYAGVFADPSFTVLSDMVSENIVALALSGGSETSATIQVGVEDGSSTTVYVTEVDANGTPVETSPSFEYNVDVDQTDVTLLQDESATVTITNTELDFSSGFDNWAELTITKKLLAANGTAKNSNETFYAGVFADEAHTVLSDMVSENIVALALNGGSEASATIQVGIAYGSSSTRLYVTEVDANGTPVAGSPSFAYDVTINNADVTLQAGDSLNVTITNREREVVRAQSNEQSETTATVSNKSVQTGDSTPIMPYVALMLAAAFVLTGGELRRRKNRANR